MKSDENLDEIKFTLSIIQWYARGLEIAFNISNPLIITQGDYLDSFEIGIKSRAWFRSASSGKVLAPENAFVSNNFPI